MIFETAAAHVTLQIDFWPNFPNLCTSESDPQTNANLNAQASSNLHAAELSRTHTKKHGRIGPMQPAASYFHGYEKRSSKEREKESS